MNQLCMRIAISKLKFHILGMSPTTWLLDSSHRQRDMRISVLLVVIISTAAVSAVRYVDENPLSPGKQVWHDQDGLVEPVVDGEQKNTVLKLNPPTNPKLVVPSIVGEDASLPPGKEPVYTSSERPALVIGSNMCCENDLCPQPCPSLDINPEADLPPSAAVPRGCCGLPGCPGPQPCPVAPQTSCCDELCPKPHPPHCFDLESIGDSVLPFSDLTPAVNGTLAKNQNGQASPTSKEEKKKEKELEKDKVKFEKDVDEAKALRHEEQQEDVKERESADALKRIVKAEEAESKGVTAAHKAEEKDAKEEVLDDLKHNKAGASVAQAKERAEEKVQEELAKEEKKTLIMGKEAKVELTKAKLAKEELLVDEKKVAAQEKKDGKKLEKVAKEVEADQKVTGDATGDEKRAKEEKKVAERLRKAEQEKVKEDLKKEKADLKKHDVKAAEADDKKRREDDKEEAKAAKEVKVAEKEEEMAATESKLQQEKKAQAAAEKNKGTGSPAEHKLEQEVEEVTADTTDNFHFHIRALPEGHYYKPSESDFGHDGDNSVVNTETSSEEEQNDLHHKNDDLEDEHEAVKGKSENTGGEEDSGSMGQELKLIAQDRDKLLKQVEETKAKLAKIGASPQKAKIDIEKLVSHALASDIGNIDQDDEDLPKNTATEPLSHEDSEKEKAAEEAETDEIKEAIALADKLVGDHDESTRLELALAVERILQEQKTQDNLVKKNGAETAMQEAEDGELDSLEDKLKSISSKEIKAGRITREQAGQVEKQIAVILHKLGGLVVAEQA